MAKGNKPTANPAPAPLPGKPGTKPSVASPPPKPVASGTKLKGGTAKDTAEEETTAMLPKAGTRVAGKRTTPIAAPKQRASAAAEEEKPLRQFQVNDDAAHHTELDGTVVYRGEVIETDADLAEMFPNKFREVKDGKYIGEHQIPQPKRRVNSDNTQENDHGHGPTASKPDQQPETRASEEFPVDESGLEIDPNKPSEDVDDVTEELFPAAKDLNYRVFSVENGYEVRTLEGEVVNTEPLASKDDVNHFLGIGENA